MALNGWLIDKSAFARLGQSPDLELWTNRIERGLVHVTTLTRLEIGYSARNGDELRAESETLASMPIVYLTPRIEDRAVDIQAILADRGQHRGPAIPDLLIAAAGELTELAVLHVDKDFNTIAKTTGQAVEQLRLEGT